MFSLRPNPSGVKLKSQASLSQKIKGTNERQVDEGLEAGLKWGSLKPTAHYHWDLTPQRRHCYLETIDTIYPRHVPRGSDGSLASPAHHLPSTHISSRTNTHGQNKPRDAYSFETWISENLCQTYCCLLPFAFVQRLRGLMWFSDKLFLT